ncbi:type II secretion system protein [Haloferula helveola]
MTRRKPHGFTLIELLVVLVIVAALAALVFAISRKAMAKSRLANCTNNMRQIGLGLTHFEGDYRRLPGRNDGMAWDRAILPYMGYSGRPEDLAGQQPLNANEWASLKQTAELFACPEDRKDRDRNFFKRSYAIVPWTTNWSNGTQFRGWKNRPFNVGVPLSIVKDLSRAAVVVEWHAGSEGIPNHLGGGGHAYHDRGGPDGKDDEVHGKKQIVLFADGHTETLPFISNAEFVERYWPGQIGSAQ